ncbi:glycoside hydrolase family 2 protein [Niabella terrae]
MFLAILVSSSLSATAQSYKPAPAALMTEWGERLTPDNAWQQYPRPQMKRAAWLNLNGLWDYRIQPKGSGAPADYTGKILVPFGIESALSGVGKPLLPDQELWYRRNFTIPADWKGRELILHFEAVDWYAKVWVNGQLVGQHKGGSDPFSFNITSFLRSRGPQHLVLSVWDPTDADIQARGKQSLEPKGIWYTAVSGIWQTVWLEPVAKSHISGLNPVPDIDQHRIEFNFQAENITAGHQLRIEIKDQGRTIKDTLVDYQSAISIPLQEIRYWTPDQPQLYPTRISLLKKGRIVDSFQTYFAMRKISLVKDANGYQRLALNNKPLFHLGTLDQGWWPDGLLTPPSEAAMMYDIVQLKKMGFNTIRKHIKVEPSRYYYMADSIGMLVWQDMPSGLLWPNDPSHVKYEDAKDWVRPPASAIQFESEWKSIMTHLRFFPSIVMWVPFNEGWGQYDTKRIAEWTKTFDPTRLVDAPSGWTDRGVGNVVDVHQYPGPAMEVPELHPGRSMVLGEFGGLGLVVNNHIWDAHKRNWGYKTYTEDSVLIREYTELMHNLSLMVKRGLSAAIYTQTTDVEGEVNGLMTYDRKVVKIPIRLLQRLHHPIYENPDGHLQFLNQSTETSRPNIHYRLNKPAADWLQQPEAFLSSLKPVEVEKGGNVYAYQEFNLDQIPDALGMKLYASGDFSVYINGVKIWSEDRVRIKRHYDDINLSMGLRLLHTGKNRIAVIASNAERKVNFDFSLYQWRR